MSEKQILVTGATGNTGSALVDLLIQRGAPVRVMVRDQGAAARFDAAPDSPVRFLRWHAEVERRIHELDIGYTFLRPNLFFQGVLAFAGTIAASSRFFAPIGGARVSAVDVRDIARVAAVALTEAGHDGRIYTITGPAAISHGDIAAALSAALGREITFVDASPQEFAEGLRGVMPPWQVDGLLEDYGHYARGEAADVYPTVADVTGRPPLSLEQFARDYAGAFAPRLWPGEPGDAC